MCVFDALVRASGHHASEAIFGTRARRVNADDALHLRMFEEEAMHGAITPIGKDGY